MIAPQRWVRALIRSAGKEGPDQQKVLADFHQHQELRNLVAAGLTPAQALSAATFVPAKASGMESQHVTLTALLLRRIGHVET
jgi:hypothetical protein